MSSEWEATPELRWLESPTMVVGNVSYTERRLQQKWIKMHIMHVTKGHEVTAVREPTGESEWRDVPEER